jgi:hypothetical protein
MTMRTAGRFCGQLAIWQNRLVPAESRRGIPQGSPISPLLANIYMRRFVLGWKMLGLEQRLGSRIVTYADDLVILCRRGKADEALQQLREIMSKLKLTVNEEKTRICKVPEGEFDFLGYTFGRMYSARTGQARLGYGRGVRVSCGWPMWSQGSRCWSCEHRLFVAEAKSRRMPYC